MNWYKTEKEKGHDVLDTQLLCCGDPENRRDPKDPYTPKKKKKKE